MESLLGTGVFNSDGEMWKFHRSITRPMFTREKIGHFDLFDRRASQVITKARQLFREEYAIDFQDPMPRFTLDAATEFLFDTCVESMSADLPYPFNATYVTAQRTERGDAANTFAHALMEVQEVLAVRERYGWVWPLTETTTRDNTYAPMQIINVYIEPIVKEALRKTSQLVTPGQNEKATEEEQKIGVTLLDHLVKVTNDHVVLKDEM